VSKRWRWWILLPLLGIVLYLLIFFVLAPLGVRFVLTHSLMYQSAKQFIGSSTELVQEVGTPVQPTLEDGHTYAVGTQQISDFDVLIVGPRKQCFLFIELAREGAVWVPTWTRLRCPGSPSASCQSDNASVA
jgi:hypothetical protein